jgi:phosphinothricin acetyltransferase
MTIRAMAEGDWGMVRSIYEQGIATGDATFQTEAPSWADWDSGHLSAGRIVAEAAGRVIGWAALSRVSARPAYAGVAEVSVYVADEARGCGVGRMLLEELVRQAEHHGLWTLQAGIFPENSASLPVPRTLRLSPRRPPGTSRADAWPLARRPAPRAPQLVRRGRPGRT